MRWTDDTQMSLDLAESLIANRALDLDDLAARFASSYRWSRGYGPGTAKLLRRIARGAPWRDATTSVYPDGSLGNGGAMRAPVTGLFYAFRAAEVVRGARESARVTHAHPLGLEGAVLVAVATAQALLSAQPLEIVDTVMQQCEQGPFRQRLDIAREWIGGNRAPSPTEVSTRLGSGIAAVESCPTALYVALRFLREPFEVHQMFVAECRGDVDTIGAMSGAIWGAANGASRLPGRLLDTLEARARIEAVAEALYRARVTG